MMPQVSALKREEVEELFSFQEGFHDLDWMRAAAMIEQKFELLDQPKGFHDLVLMWLDRLREDLGGSYEVCVANDVAILCDQPRGTAQWLLRYAQDVMIAIREGLGQAAWHGEKRLHPILIFSEQDDYYQYVSRFCPDGEQAGSGGMCINAGYPHIVLFWHDETDAANGLVHELTHECLMHLSLPLWVNEGVAMSLQRNIAPAPAPPGQGVQEAVFAATINWTPPLMWYELKERHLDFWNEERLQSFWAGRSFYVPGDSNELSYSLAEVFIKLLAENKEKIYLERFLEHARPEDAGQSAALDILHRDLGEIAATFLGPGKWHPSPAAISRYWSCDNPREEH